jgi:hypothetical protein
MMTLLGFATVFFVGGLSGWLYRDIQLNLERQRREDRIFRTIQERMERGEAS